MPDVILLDWNMPVMSGMEFLRALRQADVRRPAQGRLLHHRERHRPYPRRDRRRRRRICDEAVRPRDAPIASCRSSASRELRQPPRAAAARQARRRRPFALMIVDDSAVARAVLSRMIAAHRGFRDRRHRRQRRRGARRARRRSASTSSCSTSRCPARAASRRCPTSSAPAAGARVLIVSSMAEDGAETTVRALALGRRRHPAQARHRQFRRPLLPRSSPIGCAGSAAPSAKPTAAPPAATRRRSGCATWPRARSAASRSAPRPAASTPCSTSCARCRRGSARRSWSPSICPPSSCPISPASSKRLGPHRAGRRGRRRCSPTRSSTSRRATPISASSSDGGEVRVRLDRKRAPSRLPALGRSDARLGRRRLRRATASA